jgi:uncharacterized protein YukE
MAYLMLLLVSCLLIGSLEAIPSKIREKRAEGQVFEDDDDNLINNFFGNLTGTMVSPQKIMQETNKATKLVKTHLEEVEKEITYIYAQLAAITEGQANFSKSFIHEFNQVKRGLRESRQELRQLGQETKTLTQDVIDMWDHEDELTLLDVEVALSSLKELLKRTKIQLTKARLLYNNVIDKMNDISTTMQQKIITLDELSDEKSDRYNQVAVKARAGAYGSCGAVTVGCIICDALVCLGICSAAATSACWATSVTAVEVSLEIWTSTIEIFKGRAEEIQDKILGLEAIVKKATTGLEEELDILVRWDSISGTLDSKLQGKNFQAKVLTAAKRIRTPLVRHVKELKSIAEEYLAQPAAYFSDFDVAV